MRIVCEKCQAAYAIDDRLITARGVRAQCPKCRHLQLVTKDGAASAPAQSPASASAPASSAGPSQPRMPPQNFPGGAPPPPATTPVSTPRVPPEAFPSGPTPSVPASSRASAAMPAVAPVVPPVAPSVAPVVPPVSRGAAGPAPSAASTQKIAPAAAPPAEIDFASWDVPSPPPAPTGASAAASRGAGETLSGGAQAATEKINLGGARAGAGAFGAAGANAPGSASAGARPGASAGAGAFGAAGAGATSSGGASAGAGAGASTGAASPAGARPGGGAASAGGPGAARASGAAATDDSILTGGAGPATMGCRECGKPLTDAFDQALGMCDSCRTKADAAVNGPVQPEPKGAGLDLLDLTPAPPPSPFDDALDAAAASAASSAAPERPRPPPSQGFVMTASTGAASEGGKGKWIALAIVFVVLAGAGAAAFVFRDKLPGAKKPEDPNALPPAIEAVLPSWRMANVEVSGTAQEHLTEGQKLLDQDRVTSYDQATEEFQKALLLDPKSDAAIAGYVRALALGRGTRVDDATWDSAQKLIAAAEKRSNRSPETVLAHAHLLLSRPADATNVQAARSMAEEILGKTKDAHLQADAHLVVGRSWQSTSSPLAVDSFTQALELDPQLRTALFQRALANEASGNFSAALEDLQKRLAIDPDHWASNEELARIYRDAARPNLARQVYQAVLEKFPNHPRARLELAVFRYQVDGKVQEALTELRAMAKNLDAYEDRDQAEILSHLATAERLAGNDNAAVDAAQKALKIAPNDPAPQLQLFLVALKRGVLTDADKDLAALNGKLDDTGLEKLLEGRLRMEQQKWDEAVAAFDEAIAADARRIDARLLAGIAAASAGKQDVAFEHLLAAARSDPARSPPLPVSTRFYLQPVNLMRGFDDRILKLGKNPEDLLPKLYEAVFRFHTGDIASTTRLTAQVTNLDENNALGHAWHAFAALKTNDARGAASSGERAVAANRQVALAQYASGAALAAGGKDEDARRALQEALRLDPALLGAEQKLAELDARRKDVASARQRLTHILSLDPGWLPAKQLLFALEKEKPGEGAGPR